MLQIQKTQGELVSQGREDLSPWGLLMQIASVPKLDFSC